MGCFICWQSPNLKSLVQSNGERIIHFIFLVWPVSTHKTFFPARDPSFKQSNKQVSERCCSVNPHSIFSSHHANCDQLTLPHGIRKIFCKLMQGFPCILLSMAVLFENQRMRLLNLNSIAQCLCQTMIINNK